MTTQYMNNAKKHLRPAIFLDRDGTLNKDIGYLHKVEDWQWLPHVQESLVHFAKAGYLLVVISNQSGIARGYYTAKQVDKLHEFMNKDLQPYKVKIDAFYYCPHHPDYDMVCSCRKPKPQMIFQAAKTLQIDLEKSWMIGDNFTDVQAGLSAKCRSILICYDRVQDGLQQQDVFYAKDFHEATLHILQAK